MIEVHRSTLPVIGDYVVPRCRIPAFEDDYSGYWVGCVKGFANLCGEVALVEIRDTRDCIPLPEFAMVLVDICKLAVVPYGKWKPEYEEVLDDRGTQE